MALQKFAHGATHYCKFKHTALCENALHYDNKTTINKQILCRFQKIFFSKIKKLKHTFYRQIFCALSGRSLSWNTPVFSRFTPREHANFTICHFFHTHVLPHHSKAQLLRYCGTRSFLGVAKSWKATLIRVPWFGRHVENLGDVIIYPVLVVARTARDFFQKQRSLWGLEFFIYLFIFYQFCLFICSTEDHTCTVVNNGTCAVLSAHTVIWRQRSFIQVFYVSASVLSMDRSSSYRRSSYS